MNTDNVYAHINKTDDHQSNYVERKKPEKKYILYSFIYIKFKKMQTNLLWKADQCLPGEGRRQEWRKDYKGAGSKSWGWRICSLSWLQGWFWASEVAQWLKKKKKKLHTNAGDSGSIPGWGRSAGEGNGNPFQGSCLRNPMDKGDWWATVQGVTQELEAT